MDHASFYYYYCMKQHFNYLIRQVEDGKRIIWQRNDALLWFKIRVNKTRVENETPALQRSPGRTKTS